MRLNSSSVLAVVTLCMLGTCAAGAQTVIFVDADATGAGNGTSWADAYTSVQPALNAAQPGDEVWAAAGRYVENITLALGVALYGGFAGTEDPATFDLSTRDFVANETILDGNQSGSVATGPLSANGLTRIDGFTLTNGSGTVSGSDTLGGGMYLYGSSPTIAHCAIRGNSAKNGAGVYMASSASVITDSTIADNVASNDGGGVCLVSAMPTIRNNTIARNSAVRGAGIHMSSPSVVFAPTVANNVITANKSSSWGGALYVLNHSPFIVNNTIAGNSGNAGGMYLGSGSPTVANNIIAFNSSGIRRGSATITLRCNCVYGNVSYNYADLTDPTGTNGNISVDPLFADLTYNNWHIQPDSPCVDAGANGDAVGSADIDGQPRIQPVGGTVDIGADESDGTVWGPGSALVVRVAPWGADDQDGSTWVLAKRTVQAGVDATADLGGEVWVVAGTYYERVTLLPYAHVFGGFAGTETQRAERDWTVNVTTLNGQRQGSVVTAGVCVIVGASTIDGFTITNGSGTMSGSTPYGGGVYVSGSSPTIANNTITCNHVGDTSGYGGGLYLYNSVALIANSRVSCNVTGYLGGGVYAESSSPTIANSVIAGNAAVYGQGGGLYLTGGAPTIVSCTIADNSAPQQAGGLFLGSSPAIMANTIVAFNSSGISGSSSGTLTLAHNCVYGNVAYDYSGVSDPTGTNGNVSADPRFGDRVYGNRHLQPDSPCIGAGDNGYAFGEVDMDGEPRIQPAGGTIDIGADEADGTLWPPGPNVVVRVSPTGNDDNDGSSWAQAKLTVQAGIDRAAALGGEVWVAGGTYSERITLHPYVHAYGGFAGSEEQRDERDWAANDTVLDGERLGSVVSCFAGDGVSRIDGFTITNGRMMTAGSWDRAAAGGIRVAGCSPTIVNNTITGNEGRMGGGISLVYASPIIEQNVISGNTVTLDYAAGGGLYLYRSHPEITNNTIVCNTGISGAGLFLKDSSPSITNNTIAYNRAEGIGGGLYGYSSSPVFANNVVLNNIAYTSGGGLYGDSLLIVNSLIVGNTLVTHTTGGGVVLGSSGTMANTIVAFNSSGVYAFSPTMLQHNCVFGNTLYDYRNIPDPTGTNGNISADPQLGGLLYGSWHIEPTSPCVDAGSNTYVATELDWDGQPRVQPAGGTVDIGVDESDGTLWGPGPYVTVRVSPQGDDDNDGSSWNAAKRTVQAGIDAAAALGGEVWVAAGTYYERITLPPYAYLFGGFAGTETQCDERDWRANSTVLDAQQQGSVVTVPMGKAVSAIDGFKLTHGFAAQGGGLHVAPYASPAVAHCTIADNTAGSGGGVYVGTGGAPQITHSTIMANSAYFGGGLWLDSGTTVTVANSAIRTNAVAYTGGGVYLYGGTTTLTGSTITGNSAAENGGGLHHRGGALTMANTIVAFNSSGVYRSTTTTPTLSNNCVYGNTAYDYSGLTDPTGTNGNISVDPLFVQPPDAGPDGVWGTADDDYGDLHLLAGSPCIDAGDNAYVFGDFDLDGLPRIVDGDENGTAIVDMGAYEFQVLPPVCAGDANCDGIVSWRDIDYFVAAMNDNLAAWQALFAPGGPTCPFANNDVNADGTVSWRDIDPLVAVMNTGCP